MQGDGVLLVFDSDAELRRQVRAQLRDPRSGIRIPVAPPAGGLETVVPVDVPERHVVQHRRDIGKRPTGDHDGRIRPGDGRQQGTRIRPHVRVFGPGGDRRQRAVIVERDQHVGHGEAGERALVRGGEDWLSDVQTAMSSHRLTE